MSLERGQKEMLMQMVWDRMDAGTDQEVVALYNQMVQFHKYPNIVVSLLGADEQETH